MTEKMKILTISDMPFSPTGVGIQTRYVIEYLLKTGNYQFVSLGGAVKHHDYKPIKTDVWGDDWVIYPVDHYGNQDIVRAMIKNHRPDFLLFVTDPRSFEWLWDIENEVRATTPMVYYHVWDNYPYPSYNKQFYDSTDYIVTISKVTDDIVKTVAPDVKRKYIPHHVDMDIFRKFSDKEISEFRKKAFPDDKDDKFLFFWNSRNARRKQTGSIIWWFNDFLNEVGRDKARLLMHTDPRDINGPNLEAILAELKLTNGEVMFSTNKLNPQDMAHLYNIADCTLSASDAEGFGCSTLESLACETPICVTMTGGLQEQVTDGEEWFGFGMEPCSKAVIGSQQVPFIYEDRISKETFVETLKKMYNLSPEERKEMGRKGRLHLEKNYNGEILLPQWEEVFEEVKNNMGSWEDRKGYNSWKLIKL